MLRSLALAAVVVTLAACGTQNPPDTTPAPECIGKTLVNVVPEGGTHTDTCEDTCGNGLNPPTGGPHCPTTAACRAQFQEPIHECQWVHNLEHGHVVLLYNCPEGCPEIVDELTEIWRDSGFDKRMLVTPWPKLEKKVAAVVWGWSWSGDEIDRDAITCIISHQDEDAPEAGISCLP